MTSATLRRPKSKRTILSLIPILGWLRAYNLAEFRPDVIAAITVWALLVPEAMAYAGIAGMPPQAGLYTAPLALIAYAVFGTSRHLNVGPSSTVAIISIGVVSAIAVTGTEQFYAMTSALAIVAGIIMVIGGFLRFGVLADFLSKPILDGFIVGLAVTIAAGQLDKLLGYSVDVPDFVPETLVLLANIGQLHIWTFTIGMASLAGLFLMEKFYPKIPAAITIVIAAIALSWLFDTIPFLPGFEQLGVHIVGEIPGGRIPFGLPQGLSIWDITSLIPGAIAIAIVGFSESVAAARNYATKFDYDIDADQEMIALGVANLGAGVSGGFSVDGSLSKTAASVQAGAKTQMVSLIAAAMILVTAWFLTGLFYFLPEATLGAIVIHAVWHLINYKSIWKYRKYTPVDYWTSIIAAAGVLVFGILTGLMLAVVVALLALLVSAKNCTMSVIGKVTEAGVTGYRSLANFPNAQVIPGLLILRFDGSMFFANAPEFTGETMVGVNQTTPAPRVVLIDASESTDIDATAILAIQELHGRLESMGVDLRFANVHSDVRTVMQSAGLEDVVGSQHFYLTIEVGVDAFLAEKASEEVSANGQTTAGVDSPSV